MKTFERLESEVRTYCRDFPVVFTRGLGSYVYDEHGRPYIDFLSGAGALNYGHNNPVLKARLIEYMSSDGITHSLDLATTAKRDFLETFDRVILAPRNLRYKVQFCGPTGANAVEAALKLARMATGRHQVVFFSNAYHGLSMGSLAITAERSKRNAAGVPLSGAMPLPFDGDLGPNTDTLDYFEWLLENPSSGLDLPAAVIVETVQAEGGVRIAHAEWLRRLEAIVRRHHISLIVDDIQVGCGRTGSFFSFEDAGLDPDLVCLSKSISGYGLPMAIVLIKPEHDVWKAGEHSGTFRGNNLAFVTATEALRYWQDTSFGQAVRRKGALVKELLLGLLKRYPEASGTVRGCGLIWGLVLERAGLAQALSAAAFERQVIVETAGPGNQVLKLLPSLTISEAELADGVARISDGLGAVLARPEVKVAMDS